jgi:hypothetical protein
VFPCTKIVFVGGYRWARLRMLTHALRDSQYKMRIKFIVLTALMLRAVHMNVRVTDSTSRNFSSRRDVTWERQCSCWCFKHRHTLYFSQISSQHQLIYCPNESFVIFCPSFYLMFIRFTYKFVGAMHKVPSFSFHVVKHSPYRKKKALWRTKHLLSFYKTWAS